MHGTTAYRLIDCGDGRRLEQFGSLVVDRPAPGADGRRRDPGRWPGAVAYRAGRGWASAVAGSPPSGDVPVDIAGVRLLAGLAPGGQVGVFPEHAASADWLRGAIDRRSGPATVLNLFAYTGLLTLVAAAAGAQVIHVDASRPAVAWARRNADASRLADRPIRWLADDALGFARREGRRGRRYDGVILDPPSYGHGGPHGHAGAFRLERDLGELLVACKAIAGPDALWLLSGHTAGWDGPRLAATLAAALGVDRRAIEVEPLELVADSGARLELGGVARFDPLAREPR